MRPVHWIPVLFGVAVAFAVPRAGRAEDPPGEPRVVITVPEGGIRVPELLMALGRMTGRAFTWNLDDKVVGTSRVETTGDLSVPRDGLYDAVRGLLFRCEIVLLPKGAEGPIHVASLRELMSTAARGPEPEEVDSSEATIAGLAGKEGWYVTTTVAVRNLEDLPEARVAVAPLLSGNKLGSVADVADARAFVVTDFAPRVARVVRTLRDLDARAAVAAHETAHLPLARAPASVVVPVLRELFPASVQDPAIVPALRRLRIVSDPWSNQVVVLGTAGQIRDVRTALAGLDRDPVPTPTEKDTPR